MVQMLSNIATHTCFISLYDKEDVIACGLGVIERDYIGLYDIVIVTIGIKDSGNS